MKNDSIVGGNGLSDNPVRNILNVSIPVTISQFLMTLGSFVSVFLLSYLGTQVFGASMLISSIQLLFMTVPFAVLYIMGPMISHAVAGDLAKENIGVFFRAGIIISLLISILIIICFLSLKPILLLLHQPPHLVNIVQHYFNLFIWVVPLSGLSRLCFQVALGFFRQKIVLLLSLFSLLLFSLVGYGLVLGKFGLPALGVTGLAWAYIIQGVLNVVFMLVYLMKDKALVPYRLFDFGYYRDFKACLKQIMIAGTPVAMQMGNELLSLFVTTIMVGWLGATALTAKQLTVQYMLLVVIPLFGISQASAIFVGKFLGMKQFQQLRSYGNVSILMGLGYTLAIVSIFMVIPKPFIQLFFHGKPVPADFIHLVSILLIIVMFGQIFDGIKSTATGALRGLGDTKFAFHLSFICIWLVGVPLAYVFGFLFDWGLIGIASAHIVGGVIMSLLLLKRWTSKTHDLVAVNVVKSDVSEAVV